MPILLEARDQTSTSLTDIAHLTEGTCDLVYHINISWAIQQAVTMDARLFSAYRGSDHYELTLEVLDVTLFE